MRRAVRRLTLLLFSLALSTLLAFALVASTLRTSGEAAPLFFNPSPRNARDLTQEALAHVLRNDSKAEAGAVELARLGGAALPFVLPGFDKLDTGARERVAVALSPVAKRMGAATDAELSTPERAAEFWSRFWQDQSVDFREPVVRRLVARLAERSLALRREDVLELDTYAIPELVKALGKVQTADDVLRVRRLTQVLSHVAGEPFVVEQGANIDVTRRGVRIWKAWWDRNGSDFTALDGPNRLVAMVRQTRYGRWLLSVPHGDFGRSGNNRSGLELLRTSASPTLLRFYACLSLAALLSWLKARLRGDGLKDGIRRALSVSAGRAPFVGGLVLAAESALRLRGLGAELCAAFVSREVEAVVTIVVGLAIASSGAILLSDLITAVLFREAPNPSSVSEPDPLEHGHAG